MSKKRSLGRTLDPRQVRLRREVQEALSYIEQSRAALMEAQLSLEHLPKLSAQVAQLRASSTAVLDQLLGELSSLKSNSFHAG